MRYGRRSTAKIGIGILVILLLGLCGVGKTLPKGVIPTPSTGAVAVGITTDRGTYAPGDTIKITITVDKSCYLYLYDIDPAGTVTLLFPNRFQPDPHVQAGKLVLPGKGYRLVVASPEGEETLLALASATPVPLLKLKDKKVAFQSFTFAPEEFAKKLRSELNGKGYSTAWTQIHVYQPKGTVLISSAPEGARIYVNGDYVGTTPKALVLPAGENTITLQKDGFRPYTQTITLADRTAAEISARLEQAPLPPPVRTETPLSGFLGLDFGKDSLGGEFGIGQVLGFSIAARFLDDPRLDGPELVLGIRLHVPAQGTLRGILGVEIGLQERYIVVPSGVPIPESIVPELETETQLFPSLMIGLEIHYRYGYLFGGYDLRRGLVGGIGIAF